MTFNSDEEPPPPHPPARPSLIHYFKAYWTGIYGRWNAGIKFYRILNEILPSIYPFFLSGEFFLKNLEIVFTVHGQQHILGWSAFSWWRGGGMVSSLPHPPVQKPSLYPTLHDTIRPLNIINFTFDFWVLSRQNTHIFGANSAWYRRNSNFFGLNVPVRFWPACKGLFTWRKREYAGSCGSNRIVLK